MSRTGRTARDGFQGILDHLRPPVAAAGGAVHTTCCATITSSFQQSGRVASLLIRTSPMPVLKDGMALRPDVSRWLGATITVQWCVFAAPLVRIRCSARAQV